VTLALFVISPPDPLHVRVKVFVPDVGKLKGCVPEVALLPDHSPVAVHEFELDELHEITDDCPTLTVEGDDDIESVGGWLTETLTVDDSTVPPGP